MWPDQRVVELVSSEFIPVRVHVRDQAQEFQKLGDQYGVQWTPTIVMMDPSGKEQHRIEGFLPLTDFLPQLEFGVARINFSIGKFNVAERRFRNIVKEYPDSDAAPEALYWAGVSKYKGTDDAAALQETAAAFNEQYQDSTWAKKASVWAPK